MSKHRSAMASKRAHGPRMAAKTPRATRAVVRDSQNGLSPSAGAATTEQPSQDKDAILMGRPAFARNQTTTLQDDAKPMTNGDSRKTVDFSSADTMVRAYQAKLLEIAQTNMQFAFEFAQRLASIRSPVEFPGVIVQFTGKRIAMFQKHSTELAELGTSRWRLET